MPRVVDIAEKVRSKNAGPFWLTIDIFCGTEFAFHQICEGLESAEVACLFGIPQSSLKRFEIPDLRVVKFSMPRPSIQGAIADRDMHGAGWANLLAEASLS